MDVHFNLIFAKRDQSDYLTTKTWEESKYLCRELWEKERSHIQILEIYEKSSTKIHF